MSASSMERRCPWAVILRSALPNAGGQSRRGQLPGRASRELSLSTRTSPTGYSKPPLKQAITAPAAVANGQVVFGGEDGFLYVLGPGPTATSPSEPLDLDQIRSPLTSRYAAWRYNWDTHFGNQANTTRTVQDLQLPLAMRWIRRCEGTIKHLSTFGGGRMYTHTAEGQIMAVEQET